MAQFLGCYDTVKQIFSTDPLLPRDRYDCWHEVVCKHVIDHDSIPDSRVNFQATLDAGSVGDLALVTFETGLLTVVHDRHHIDATADELILVRTMRGHLTLDQAGRHVGLEPGMMSLVEPRIPYNSRVAADSKLLVLKYPRRELMARVGRVDDFVARPLMPDSGESGLLSHLLGILPEHTEGLGAPS